MVPVQNIASGAQVDKHTDPQFDVQLGGADPGAVTSNATVGVSAGGSCAYLAGATVPLTATVTNASSTAISLDEMVLGLPSGWAYRRQRDRRRRVGAKNPYDAGTGTLAMVGPFWMPANATVTFAIDATASTSGTFTAYGNLAGGRVAHATANASDNSPASTTLTVLGAPTAADDTRTVFTQTTSAINVLADDNTGGGTATLSIVTPPANGTATVNGTHIDYTPNDAYFGPDPFDYRLTNAVGSSDATVDVTVIDPLDAPAPPTTDRPHLERRGHHAADTDDRDPRRRQRLAARRRLDADQHRDRRRPGDIRAGPADRRRDVHPAARLHRRGHSGALPRDRHRRPVRRGHSTRRLSTRPPPPRPAIARARPSRPPPNTSR